MSAEDFTETSGSAEPGHTVSSQPTRVRVGYGFRAWFRTPPRRHGEIMSERAT